MRIAINGFGRIGRSIVRALFERHLHTEIDIVAINELAAPEAIAHLLQYDTTHGRFGYDVQLKGSQLLIEGQKIQLLHTEALSELPWQALGIDVVLECTGKFGDRESLEQHLHQGAKQVLLSQPGAANLDQTIIYGVNEQQLTTADQLISSGSCTTNCIVPVISILDEQFAIDSGTITTIHASMHDQQVIDAYHSDLRRTRAASQSIIPVDTKLALGIERILPKFAGRFEAIAVRVPTINVTAMDLSVTVKESVSIQEINAQLQRYITTQTDSIVDYTEAPLVSIDFNHNPHSAIVDGSQTRVSHGHLVKLLVWCDNEWGFANRMIDTALVIKSLHS